jgi:hypothetical protein
MVQTTMKRDKQLRTIKLTSSNRHQIVLLATDDRILCYQTGLGKPFEPFDTEDLGVALAVNRLRPR